MVRVAPARALTVDPMRDQRNTQITINMNTAALRTPQQQAHPGLAKATTRTPVITQTFRLDIGASDIPAGHFDSHAGSAPAASHKTFTTI